MIKYTLPRQRRTSLILEYLNIKYTYITDTGRKTSNIRVRKKCDFNCASIVGTIWAGLRISKSTDLLVLHSAVYTECCKKKQNNKPHVCRDIRRLIRLVWADMKSIVTQINTHYKYDERKSISDHITHQALKLMGYNSRIRFRSCQPWNRIGGGRGLRLNLAIFLSY